VVVSLFYGLTAFILDRAHKYWQVDLQGWTGGEHIRVTGSFDYVLVWNTGISYGLLGDVPLVALGALIVVAIAALGYWWWKATHLLVRIGLMLCIGGALSNAIDRLRYGAVADFFHFHWQDLSFYIFNLADVAITFGVLLLILDLIGIGRPRQAGQAQRTHCCLNLVLGPSMVYKARTERGAKGRFMHSFSTGRRAYFPTLARAVLASVGLLGALALSACTTTEGTNALTDVGTFEREVMTSTLQGLAIVPRETKPDIVQKRAPLVLPKKGQPLPQPTDDEVEVAALPEDSNNPQIDMTGLTDADLERLRNARVVDLHTLSGRPLTDAEAKQLTARMTAARLTPGPRPLYLPPEEYFTQIDGKDLVCMAKSGQIVPIDSPDCPYEVKKAIGKVAPQSGGLLGGKDTSPN